MKATYALDGLTYYPETGVFLWTDSKCTRIKKGSLAGRTTDKGYVQIYWRGKRYAAHRLAWFFVHSAWPKGQLDHINRDRGDNRIDNLRDVSNMINSLNTKATGYDKLPSGNYRARLQVEGKRVGLGTFQNPEDARKAYEKAKGDYLESNL